MDPRLDETQPYLPPDGNQEKPKNGWFKGCLIGCLAVGVLSIIICAGVSYYAYKNGPQLVIQGTRQVLTALLVESNLPDEEQTAILEQFDRVGTGYLAGDVSLQDVGAILQDLAESPLVSALLIQVVDAGHLDKSGLSDEEKAEARDTLKRVFYGVMNDQLDQSELDALMQHIRKNPNSAEAGEKLQIKDAFTDDELRGLIADAKEICDAKEIPLEETEIKISDKMKEIIDKRIP